MNNTVTEFESMDALVEQMRITLTCKKHLLLFAYNGTGKTRLSTAFKEAGKQGEERDTLYFNAFTEDLFVWDNDLENDIRRELRLNTLSRFFNGLEGMDMDTLIRKFLRPLADFDFRIDFKVDSETGKETWTVIFNRGENYHIKVSRGEENIFKWCFFLAIAQLAIDEQEAYNWVKYLYIDDPISSLDDNNAIAVASRLAQMLKKQENKIKTVISSHHTLFFNVLCNELKSAKKYFLSKGEQDEIYVLTEMYGDTARFYHVAMLKELKNVAATGNIYTYHFSILRNLLEKTAHFHGFTNFGDCIKQDKNDEEGVIRKRIINLLNHGNYSLFEPIEMLPENKAYFCEVLNSFMDIYRFNPEIFPQEELSEDQT